MSSAQDYNQLSADKLAHASAIEVAPLADAIPPIQTVALTAYTAQPNDGQIFTRFNNGGAIIFTVPKNSVTPFPIGTEINYSQAGAGVVTVTPAAGVTINSRGGLMATAGQYAAAMLKKVAADTWLLIGDLA
jgi:hypothetical protein